MLRSLLFAALALLLAAPALAQTGTAVFAVNVLGVSAQQPFAVTVYASAPGVQPRVAVADASGLVTVPNLPLGEYRAFPGPAVGYLTRLSFPAVIRADSSFTGIVVLETPDPLKGIVRGRLTEEATGAPVRFDRLSVRLADAFASPSTIDGEGRYAFQVAPGTYAAEYRFYDPSDPAEVYFPIDVPFTAVRGTSTVADATVRARAVGQASGIVTSAATGAPLAGVGVLAVAVDDLYSARIMTGANGRFAAALPENDYVFQIDAPPPPFRPQVYDGVPFRSAATLVRVAGGATRAGVDFALRQPAPDFAVALSGQITDTAGRAVPGAVVTLLRDGQFADSTVAAQTGGGAFALTTPNTGLAGTYLSVEFRAEGFVTEYFDDAPDPTVADLLEVGYDRAAFSLGTVVLARTGEDVPGAAISGTVADEATGAPLGRALVAVARLDAPGLRYAVTTAAGAYRLDGLAPGTYAVLFTEADHAPEFFPDARSWTAATPIAVGTDDVGGVSALLGGLNRPVSARPAGDVPAPIQGTVRDAAGAVVGGALVVARDADGRAQAYSLSDAAGRFSLDGTGDGIVTVAVDRPRFVPRAAEGAPGAQLFVTLSASTVTAADGAPATVHGALAVFPNPARARASLAFALPAPADARVTVVDVLGREVLTAASGAFEAGAHVLEIDTSALPAGLYVARVATATATLARPFTVVR